MDDPKNENFQIKLLRMLAYCAFAHFIFADARTTAKSVKILSHENFPLYGSYIKRYGEFLLTQHHFSGQTIDKYTK